ncbi:MAG: phosphodiesterase [Candidatus Enteromonas sp.]|nr:phosphodiesterase [Candidatus Enteromonas sp.]
MRILIASDIHGRILAAKKLDKLFQRYNPDKVILLGDYLYNGPRNGVPQDYDPMGTSIILNKYAHLITGVKGNCDSRIDETLLKFPIQDSRVVYLNGFRVDMVHGDLLTSDILNVERGDILMFGHTHVYMLKKEDGVIYFNPGSTSFPKNGNPATYGVMDGMHLEIRKLDDDLPVKFLDLF